MSNDLFSLAGRVALVTGGNGGLGRALALGLQAAGARVAVTGRDPAKNDQVRAELAEAEAVFPLDVRDEAAVAETVAAVARRFGRLDILVNNAGLYQGGGALELTRADWQAVLDAHLTGSFLCAQQAARHMLAGGRGGKIINIGSMYSLFGAPAFPHYAAAKAGVLGLTRSLAVELAPHHIQVNAILPGWFETDLTRATRHGPPGELIRRKTPAGRWGEAEDLVGAAVFLASAASDFVTGAALPVDGGYSVADRFQPE
jgi:2-deoxy-D-gluconate 3-dehydrogenase